MSTKAFILMETAVATSREVVGALRALPGVQSVDAVTGPYDIIATVAAEDMNAVSEVLANRVHKIKGVNRTLTCISLQRP